MRYAHLLGSILVSTLPDYLSNEIGFSEDLVTNSS